MTPALGYLQAVLGLLIMIGGLALGLAGVDDRTSCTRQFALVGLVAWAAWWACLPCVTRHHDSLPALAFGALVAWALLFRHRELLARWNSLAWADTQEDGGGHGR
jgi:hypothetical protein